MRTWMWGLALAGCGVAHEGELGPVAEHVQAQEVVPLLEFAQAAPADRAALAAPGVRFITLANPGQNCTVPGLSELVITGGSYSARPLFADGNLEQIPMPETFRRYCLIEWTPEEEGDLPDLDEAKDLVDLLDETFAGVGEDLQVVAPQDQALANASRAVLSSYYRSYMGQLQPLPTPDEPLAKIRIAVADTSPYSDDGTPNEGNSTHGLTMGRIAQIFSCPVGAHCPGYIVHTLALPRAGASQMLEGGGYYGYQSEVARAVAEAVLLWQTNELGGQPIERHLIINLSLGWEERSNDLAAGDPADFSMPNRAVYDALNYAACRGALIIAAAGNRTGGPDELEGPLFPAGFEARPAPTTAYCQARYGVPATEAGSGAYRPLLYAVGGVRYDDRDLAARRKGGRPRLVAGGFQVNVGLGETGINESTGVFTGSSSAAAAVSGIAAGLWAYRPDIDRHTLMQGIYNTGMNLDPAPGGASVRAEFCLGGNCGTMSVRRANMCAAWYAMCASGQDACPAPPHGFPCDSHAAYAGSMAALAPAVPAIIATIASEGRPVITMDGTQLNAALAPPAQPSVCKYTTDAMIYHRAGHLTGVEASPCLSEQFYLGRSTPWAAPQPWGNLCPTCWGDRVTVPGGTKVNLYMPTNSVYSGYTFTNPTVRFKSAGGWTLASVPLSTYGVTSFTGGTVLIVDSVPFPPLTATIELEAITWSGWLGTISAHDEISWH